MAILAIDWGQKNVGLAFSEHGKIAKPLKTLKNQKKKNIFRTLSQLCQELKIEKIVLGIPQNEKETKQSKYIKKKAKELKILLKLPLVLQDEGFTSFEAENFMHSQKSDIDSESAKIILQDYLNQK